MLQQHLIEKKLASTYFKVCCRSVMGSYEMPEKILEMEDGMEKACAYMNFIARNYLGIKVVRRIKKKPRKLSQEEIQRRTETRTQNKWVKALSQIPVFQDYNGWELVWLAKYQRGVITEEQWIEKMQVSRQDKTWGVVEQ